MVYKKDLELEKNWVKLLYRLKEVTGKRPADLNAVLYLIGVQELGRGFENFSKEEKQDLMHIAVCKLLSYDGYYAFKGRDQDGWPHYDVIRQVPAQGVKEQEEFLKKYVIQYFRELEVENGGFENH